MSYILHPNGSIGLQVGDGYMCLPAENNGTPEWAEYLAWLAEGNEPEPADP